MSQRKEKELQKRNDRIYLLSRYFEVSNDFKCKQLIDVNGVAHGSMVGARGGGEPARVQTRPETILFPNVCSRGLGIDHLKTNTDLTVPFVFF